MFGAMSRAEQIVRMSEFLDRHGSSLLSLPGVTDVGIGPRGLVDVANDVVIQVFVQSPEAAAQVRQRAAAILEPGNLEVYIRGDLEPLRG